MSKILDPFTYFLQDLLDCLNKCHVEHSIKNSIIPKSKDKTIYITDTQIIIHGKYNTRSKMYIFRNNESYDYNKRNRKVYLFEQLIDFCPELQSHLSQLKDTTQYQ